MSLLTALALGSAQPALANSGDCGWVHGRYVIANGSMVHRIWVVGTHHELNVDVSDEETPSGLAGTFKTKGYDPTMDRLFGDFYVCAWIRRVPGHMQRVHLLRARNLRIVRP